MPMRESLDEPTGRNPAPVAGAFALTARARFVAAALVLAWLVLAGRLVRLQWTDREHLSSRVVRQSSLLEEIPAPPGDIVDRHGRLLATTVTTRSLYLIPSRIDDAWKTARGLGEALGIDADALYRRLGENRGRHFLWVRRRLSDDEAQRIKALELPKGTWGFRDEYLRRYPQGALAAHVLGLRDIDGVGRGGIEESRDDDHRGTPGRRLLRRHARGREIEDREENDQRPRPGRTVTLALDAVIQMHVERELDRVMEDVRPRSAAAIVIGVPDCDVLAMASRPAFDPNDASNVAPEAWKNTAIASLFEPGSTFKPFVVGWAIQREALARDEQFDCEWGAYRMGRRVLHDHHPYGVLNVTDILVKSSNIGMAKIGERLGNRGLHEAAVRFGFGQPTGIELPGELAGILRPLDRWTSYSTGSIPMGQELAATPLQTAVAHAALASGGRHRTPRLVLATEERAPTASPSSYADAPRGAATRGSNAIVSNALDPEIARWLVTGPMREVVMRGTGRRANLDDYAVFGKSGTAQKLDPETGGYSMRLHTSSFVCGGPVESPRAIVLVVVDEPARGESQFGGTIAAPPASRILRHALVTLRVPPRAQ
ncbi:MAG: penicillin-binding protein 2 [Planctomycetaceae bacterium]